MLDPNEALKALDTEVATLRSRLVDLEKAQPRRRLQRGALVGLVALAAGTAWAASGNCPNGLQYCFVANSPATAAEVNYNFSQLREMSPESWASQPGGGSIQSTQGLSTVTSVAVPAGSYVVAAKLYGIASPTAGAHSLLCSITSTLGGPSLDFTNSGSGPSEYNNLSLLATTTLTGAGTIYLSCRSGPDPVGAYSLYGVSLVATRVAVLH
ncbi:MAG: hypothetical protein Q8N23_32270 [Archangium sp.]|nr:hypothetical protein [Archangium sp.]MDP3157389.1 hypothetical protein [Archangium sp.]MDP3571227.1 hypothetical protein [Archangium sp.]